MFYTHNARDISWAECFLSWDPKLSVKQNELGKGFSFVVLINLFASSSEGVLN